MLHVSPDVVGVATRGSGASESALSYTTGTHRASQSEDSTLPCYCIPIIAKDSVSFVFFAPKAITPSMRAVGWCAPPARGFNPVPRPRRPCPSHSGRYSLSVVRRASNPSVVGSIDEDGVFDEAQSPIESDLSFETFCEHTLAMTESDITKVLDRVPKLKGYDVSTAIAPKVDILTNELGASVATVRAAVKRSPQLLTVSSTRLRMVANWMESECRVPKEKIGPVLCKQPSLTWASLEKNLTPVLRFLRDEIDMPAESVAVTLARSPSIFGMSIENLRKKYEFFRDGDSSDGFHSGLGLGKEAAQNMFQKNPQLFSISIENAVVPKLDFFSGYCGLGDEGSIELNKKSPSILSLSLEKNIKPTFAFLEKELSLGRVTAGKLIRSRPTVLAYSIDKRVRPTVAYLTHEFFPSCDAYQAVLLTTYSLRGRIVPRTRALRKRGLMATTASGAKFAVTYTMVCNNQKFCEMVGIELEAYLEMVEGAKVDPSAGVLGWLTDGRKVEKSEDEVNHAMVNVAATTTATPALTSEEWNLETAREEARRALEKGEGGMSR